MQGSRTDMHLLGAEEVEQSLQRENLLVLALGASAAPAGALGSSPRGRKNRAAGAQGSFAGPSRARRLCVTAVGTIASLLVTPLFATARPERCCAAPPSFCCWGSSAPRLLACCPWHSWSARGHRVAEGPLMGHLILTLSPEKRRGWKAKLVSCPAWLSYGLSTRSQGAAQRDPGLRWPTQHTPQGRVFSPFLVCTVPEAKRRHC